MLIGQCVTCRYPDGEWLTKLIATMVFMLVSLEHHIKKLISIILRLDPNPWATRNPCKERAGTEARLYEIIIVDLTVTLAVLRARTYADIVEGDLIAFQEGLAGI